MAVRKLWKRALGAVAILTVLAGAVALAMRKSAPNSSEWLPPKPRVRDASPLFSPGLAAERLEGAERDRWQQPQRLVEALELRAGDTVADLGTGSGYLLPYLSRAVGPQGKVYAEEIQQEFLPALRHRADRLGNVTVVLGEAADPRLPPATVDYFVLLTVYHEVEHPVPFLRTLHRYARPGARLAIIDFDATRSGDHPAPVGHEVWTGDVLAEARAAGWRIQRRHEFLGSQFFLIFQR